jgi:hypothetical protein
MSLIKIIMLSFFGFTAILLAILLAFSFILPQRPKYDPVVPVVEISSPATSVVTPSTISASHLEQAATPPPKPTVSQPSNPVPTSAYRPQISQPPPQSSTFSDINSAGFRCAGKIHCSQMISCEEAKFYLHNCPGVKIDGNHDGIPCEKQWCK